MNAIPRYSGTIGESVAHDAVEVEITVDDAVATPAPVINAAATKVDGLGCHAGAKELKAAAAAAGKSEILARYAADYPKGPHDQPQSMCPAFGSLRVGLRMRRTATILSVRLRLLRLWPDVHLALLWCAPHRRLRSVQFRDAGHRKTVRGYPRGGVQARGSRFVRHHHHHQPLRAHRIRRAARPAARRDQRCGASSASTCPASACRPMPRPRMCWPVRCWNMPARKWSRDLSPRRAAAATTSRLWHCSARCFPPIPSASA